MVTTIKKCRICGSQRLEEFLDLGLMPLPNGFLSQPQLSKKEPLYPLRVGFCSQCTLVQLLDIVDPEVMFRNYVYIPSASNTRVENFNQIVSEMLGRLPKTKTSLAVDIGSNDGSLLLEFKKASVNILGVDPAENLTKVAELRGIHTLPIFFSSSSAKKIVKKYGQADYITATNVVAHVSDLDDFFSGIRILLSPKGIFVCEFPYLIDLLQKNYFDTIYHEHLSYFSVTALAYLFKKKQLKIVEIRRTPIDGGALRITIARDSSTYAPSPATEKLLLFEKQLKLDNPNIYHAFGDRVRLLRKEVKEKLYALKKKGKIIAGYGAAARGNILLNYCGIDHHFLSFIVDSTPYKQGLFTPGTHVPIFPESEIAARRPDYVLILAWNFASEIMEKQTQFYKDGGQFIIPVPTLQVVAPYQEKKKQKVVVVMPAYNAAKTITSAYRKLPRKYVDQVILVDDSSTDDTVSVARKLPITVFENELNLGYGGNLKVCLSKALEAGADIVIEYHPDDQYDPKDLPKFIEKAQEGFDFALGSRFIYPKEALKNHMPLVKFIANRAMSFIDELVLGLELSEFHSGFRMYSRKLLEGVPFRQNSDDYLFSFDIIVQAVFWNFKITDVPISCRYHPAMHTANLRRSAVYALGTFKRLVDYVLAKFLRFQRGPFLMIQPAPCPLCSGTLTRFEYVVTDSVSNEQFSIFFCTPCQVGFTVPTPHDLRRYYPKEYYSDIKSRLYNLLQFRRPQVIHELKRGGSLLDIGCGDGSIQKLLPAFAYTGIETAFSRASGSNILTTGVENMKIKKESVDLVTFWESAEHLKDPQGATEKAYDALQAKGYVVIECPNYLSLERFLFGSHWFHLDPPRHLFHFTPVGLAHLLQREGFDMVSQRVIYAPEYIPLGFAQSILYLISPSLHVVAAASRSLLGGVTAAFMIILLFPVAMILTVVFYLCGSSPILLTIARKPS